jgi:hypothetical protein
MADILDEQGKYEFAINLRYAASICEVFSKVNLKKTHELSK